MKPHSTGSYKDGYIRVEYCTVCGAEGLELRLSCEPALKPSIKNDNQEDLFSKHIDTSEERS